MKHRYFVPLCALLLLAGMTQSCLPIYLAANNHPAAEMAPVDISRDATLRVVHADPGNPVQLFVETVLTDIGVHVISAGLLSASVPLATTRYEERDTTVYRSERGTVYQRLYEDPEVDYYLKYSYAGAGGSLSAFSASLIDSRTGTVLTSYNDTYVVERSTERVMEDFRDKIAAAVRLY